MSLLKGITKKIKPKKKALLKKDEHIYRNWFLSLLVFSILVIGVAIFDAYIFFDVKNIEAIENVELSDTPTSVIDQELLIETIDFYTEKEATYNKFQSAFDGAPNI